MTSQQIKSLIVAGVFSAAFLSGSAYAKSSPDASAPAQAQDLQPATTDQTAAPAAPDTRVKSKTSEKDAAQHGCSGANGCGGK